MRKAARQGGFSKSVKMCERDTTPEGMRDDNAIASNPTQESPFAAKTATSRVRATTLEFWRAQLLTAASTTHCFIRATTTPKSMTVRSTATRSV